MMLHLKYCTSKSLHITAMMRNLTSHFSRIDTAARICGKTSLLQIYRHLEFHLPCTKQTIATKAKNIRIVKETETLATLEHHLKHEIDESKLIFLPRYQAECKLIEEIRAQNRKSAASRGLDKPEQQPKNPRRKFPWNDRIR